MSRVAVLVSLGAVVGFFLWVSRPAAQGTKINAVAGLRG